MKMKHTLTYTFLLLILLVSDIPGGLAQEQAQRQQPSQRQRIKGPRLGVDVSGLAWQYVQPGRLSVSVYGDYEMMPAIFAVAEIGRLQVKRKEPSFDYT